MHLADECRMDLSESDRLDFTWPPDEETGKTKTRPDGRPWVGIHFECCDVYVRVYRPPQVLEYVGRCPRCRAEVRLKVGPDGVASRFFRAAR